MDDTERFYEQFHRRALDLSPENPRKSLYNLDLGLNQ